MTAAAAVSQSAYAKPPYDLAREFVPVALMASAPFGLAVHPSVPAKSLKELIALAKAKPGQLSYSTPGTASSPHLTAELLRQQTGIDILHVPYKGTVPAITDTIAGNVSMTFAQTLTILPPIKSGTPARHRDLEREAQQRRARACRPSSSRACPASKPGRGTRLMAPAGTPREIVNRLNRAVVDAVQLPDVREKFQAMGAEALTSTPEQTGEFVRSEIARWGKVVRPRRSGSIDQAPAGARRMSGIIATRPNSGPEDERQIQVGRIDHGAEHVQQLNADDRDGETDAVRNRQRRSHERFRRVLRVQRRELRRIADDRDTPHHHECEKERLRRAEHERRDRTAHARRERAERTRPARCLF